MSSLVVAGPAPVLLAALVRVAAAEIELGLGAVELEEGWPGAVSVSYVDEVVVERASGLAHRAYGAPRRVGRGSRSSASRRDSPLSLSPASSRMAGSPSTHRRVRFLGADLPLIASDVTVEHLLTHTSGIGDYIDETFDPGPDYRLTVPVPNLVTTEQYHPMLDGFPTACRAGDRFAYNNSRFVVLALPAERASGRGFHDLV